MIENQSSSKKQGSGRYSYRVSALNFKMIPGEPIAYWLSDNFLRLYKNHRLDQNFSVKEGVGTRNDEVFMKMCWEVPISNIGKGKRWILTDKAGSFRKWYLGPDFLMDWENDGERIKSYRNPDGSLRSRPQNLDFMYREAVTWGLIGSGVTSFRWRPAGYGFASAAPSLFGKDVFATIGQMNSVVLRELLKVRGATMNVTSGVVSELPHLKLAPIDADKVKKASEAAVNSSKSDWNSFEPAWDFASLPLLHTDHRRPTLKSSYESLRNFWRETTLDMHCLEEEINRTFISAYGLNDELTPAVPLNEITLTCNPHYRYGGDKTEDELEGLLLADTMRELVSYAVGCMLGRYSLDKPGLILANQGETLADFLALVPQPSFSADDDNVIPVLDNDWFADDITLRFRQFLRVAFGEEHYEDNLAFIEQTLNVKGKRNYSLRDYFLGEFYTDHVKRYKKRPIYWLFCSPEGSFNALIYMHRYRSDTVSLVLKYLRDYREKLVTEKERQAAVSINPASSQGEKTKALKEVDRLGKVLAELEDYERDVLYPLATEQKQIDLDDGVKVNYLKFGTALKKITGLEAKDED